MAENLLIVHGGGPTAVLNASLYGAITEAKRYGKLEHIYGAETEQVVFWKRSFLNWNMFLKKSLNFCFRHQELQLEPPETLSGRMIMKKW